MTPSSLLVLDAIREEIIARFRREPIGVASAVRQMGDNFEMPLPLVNLLRIAQIDKEEERDEADYPAVTHANLGHRPLPRRRIEFSMVIYGAELFE